MKILIKFFLIILFAQPNISIAQDSFNSSFIDQLTNELVISESEEYAIKRMETQLYQDVADYFQDVAYPITAREEGLERIITAVIILDEDNTSVKLHFGKKKNDVFEKAIEEWFAPDKILQIIPENYIGTKAIPVKIKFNLTA